VLIGVNQCLLDPSTTLRACLLGISMFEKTKPICRPSAGNPKRVERAGLKKQSQFVPGQNEARSYEKGAYGIESAAGGEENKANFKMGNMALIQ
jgi:hypothetical protein